MKADHYFTLLDGLLATAVYHPQNQKSWPETFLSWSVPLDELWGAPVIRLSTTVSRFPAAARRHLGVAQEKGMRTSATRVCGWL